MIFRVDDNNIFFIFAFSIYFFYYFSFLNMHNVAFKQYLNFAYLRFNLFFPDLLICNISHLDENLF